MKHIRFALSALSFLSVLAFLPVMATAKSPLEDQNQATKLLKATNDVIGNKLADYTMVDQDGNTFTLKSLLGKPVIISFIYTFCPAICPTITGSLSDVTDKVGVKWGDQFNILTIGIDMENDTPDSMKEHAERFTSDFTHWKFATFEDQESLDKFLKEFAFYYRKLGDGNFDHMNMITILDGRGVIYKHIYGITYDTNEVLATISDIRVGKKPSAAYSGFVGGLKLFCSVYDPATRSYTTSFAMILNYAIQAAIIFGGFFFIWLKPFKDYRAKKRAQSETTQAES